MLREEVLQALHLTVIDTAKVPKVTRQTLHAILAERSAVTLEMAARLGKFCCDGPGLWLRLQVDHDLHPIEQDMASEIADFLTMRAA